VALPVFETQDEIPESFRDAYVEKDGKWVVPESGGKYTEADLSGLKTKNEELLGKLRTAGDRLSILGDRTPEQIKADLELAKQARESKARAEGDFESLKKQLVEQHTTELNATTGKLQVVEGKLYDVLATREIEAALTEAGGSATLMLPHIKPFVKVVEDGGDFVARVVDAKGEPRIADSKGTPMTIPQLVEVFKADKQYATAFAASDASGGGARNQGGGGGGGGTVLIPKDATPQEYRRLKAEAEKAGRTYAIAE
jgi:hypothetical protein